MAGSYGGGYGGYGGGYTSPSVAGRGGGGRDADDFELAIYEAVEELKEAHTAFEERIGELENKVMDLINGRKENDGSPDNGAEGVAEGEDAS